MPSVIGAQNDEHAVLKEGSKRSVNRPVIEEARFFLLLSRPGSLHAEIARRYINLLEIRTNEPAFDPNAGQRVLDLDRRIFAVVRSPEHPEDTILCLINVSQIPVEVTAPCSELGLGGMLRDLVTGEKYVCGEGRLRLRLWPYQVLLLKRGT
ncbi:MAG: hypothetical protein GXP48_12460 [Acidobacteria bacterium]|nr:hypothetical protein [Acidobacteriota bacterium]